MGGIAVWDPQISRVGGVGWGVGCGEVAGGGVAGVLNNVYFGPVFYLGPPLQTSNPAEMADDGRPFQVGEKGTYLVHDLWRPAPGGWDINGWDEFQLANEEATRRSEKAKKAAAARWAKRNGRVFKDV